MGASPTFQSACLSSQTSMWPRRCRYGRGHDRCRASRQLNRGVTFSPSRASDTARSHALVARRVGASHRCRDSASLDRRWTATDWSPAEGLADGTRRDALWRDGTSADILGRRGDGDPTKSSPIPDTGGDERKPEPFAQGGRLMQRMAGAGNSDHGGIIELSRNPLML